MNQLVLSGTRTLVLSGTGSSCYQGPKSVKTDGSSIAWVALNFTNKESFGFLLTDSAFRTPGDDQGAQPLRGALKLDRDLNPRRGCTVLPAVRDWADQSICSRRRAA